MTHPRLLCIGILSALSFMSASAQTAGEHISSGRSQLTLMTDQGLMDAHASFSSAISLEPANGEARFLRALCELLLAEAEPQFDDMLASFGSFRTGQLRLDGKLGSNEDLEGNTIYPDGAHTSTAVDWVKQRLQPRLAAARADLSHITDNSFSTIVTEQELGAEISVDRGDALALLASLHGVEMFFEFLFTYDLGIPMQSVAQLNATGELDAQHVLASSSSLLTFASSDRRPAFAQALRSLDASYAVASDFFQNHRDNPISPPPVIEPLFSSLGDEKLGGYLQSSAESLDGEVVVDGNRLNLSRHLSSAVPLRSWLPAFRNKAAVIGTLPDPTFGGILPDSTSPKVESRISQLGGLWGMSQYSQDIGDFLTFFGMDGSPTGDADDDGQSNFMEYVLGSSPTSRNQVVQTFTTNSTGPGNPKEVRLSFSRRKSLEDWNVVVSTSDDMIHWEKTLAEAEMVGSPVDNGDGLTETVVFRLKNSASSANRKFLRIEPLPR